jgi:hypothetical protein
MADGELLQPSVTWGKRTKTRRKEKRDSAASQNQDEAQHQLTMAIDSMNRQNELGDGALGLQQLLRAQLEAMACARVE